MFCEKYYKKLLNYAKKDQIWADPNCPYRGSLCICGTYQETIIALFVASCSKPQFCKITKETTQNANFKLRGPTPYT